MIEQGEIIHGCNKDWVISHRIGSGKCSEVYRANLQGSEDEMVAVKVFRAGPQYEWSCSREQSVFRRVCEDQGPLRQMVCVQDSGTLNGRPYLIMEHLSHDLSSVAAQWCEIGCDSLRVWQRLAADALRALSHMHAAGFIHGDVKPANFMWSAQDDCLKLIDFGLSFHQEDQDVNKVQSPGYQAPEVVTWNSGAPCGQPLTIQCDLWALGCLLLYLYTGADGRPGKLFSLPNICKNCSTIDNEELCENATLVRETIKANKLDQQGKAEFVEFVSSLVTCRPVDRPSSWEALRMSFFTLTLEPKFHDFLLLKSRVLRFLNMLELEDLRRAEDVADIREDVVGECEKFGPVEMCVVPIEGPGTEKVYVKFRWSRDADSAFQQLNGRTFNDRTVITTFFCAEDFEKSHFY